MPTPIPIMAPRVTAKSGTEMTLDNRVIRLAPMPTPNSATPTGRPMASTEPNDRIRMMMAKPRPISSDSGGSNSPSAWPPISTWRPSMSVGFKSAISVPISPVCVSLRFSERSTCAYATCPASGPSTAIRPSVAPTGEYGLVSVTPSMVATSSKSSVIAATTSGSSTPCSARKMIVPERPLPAPAKY